MGVGIGIKQTDLALDVGIGPCLVVFVRKKHSLRKLKSDAVKREIDGIKTDVVELQPRNQSSTLRPGARISVKGVGEGSAGLVARKGANTNVLLTAAHCLYGSKGFKKGVEVNLIANGQNPVLLGTTFDRHFGLDCGLIKLSAASFNNQTLCGDVSLGAPIDPVVGRTLEKCGAVSQRTQAVITTISRVDGLFPAITLKPPVGDIDESPLSEAGDSGAIWYDPETGAGVGLHVQGSARTKKREEYGVATVLTDIGRAFGLKWV